MVVYRISEPHADRLAKELVSAGIPTTIERYTNAVYLVINSERTDLDRFVRSRISTATLVPSLEQL